MLTRPDPLRRGSRAGQGCDTDKRRSCKAGSFSYGESPRTPPPEGTSLHRRNNSVERPWGILSLFTTCLRLRVWNHPATGPDTCRLRPERQCEKNRAKRRGWAKRNAKKNNTTELGKRRRKTKLQNRCVRKNKGIILSAKLNSITKMWSGVEEGTRESAKEKQCEIRGAL